MLYYMWNNAHSLVRAAQVAIAISIALYSTLHSIYCLYFKCNDQLQFILHLLS